MSEVVDLYGRNPDRSRALYHQQELVVNQAFSVPGARYFTKPNSPVFDFPVESEPGSPVRWDPSNPYYRTNRLQLGRIPRPRRQVRLIPSGVSGFTPSRLGSSIRSDIGLGDVEEHPEWENVKEQSKGALRKVRSFYGGSSAPVKAAIVIATGLVLWNAFGGRRRR